MEFTPLDPPLMLSLQLNSEMTALVAGENADWTDNSGEIVIDCMCPLPQHQLLEAPDTPKQLVLSPKGLFKAMLYSYSPKDELEAVFGGSCAKD
jgi:hypothetical protein